MEVMKLKIKPENDLIKGMYENHGHFHDGDVGLDLFIPEQIVCKAKETTVINFGIKCEPVNAKGYWMMPRSSIAKTPLRLANSMGLIDFSYRGCILAVVDNTSNDDCILAPGARLFQLVGPALSGVSFEIVDTLSETTRGEGGFGSTNKA